MNTLVQAIDSAGRTFVDLAVPMLIQSSVLIAILLLVDLVLRRRVRAVFRYWIWMLVLVKLLLPPSLWSPVSFGTWFGQKLEVPTVVLQEPSAPTQEQAPAPPISLLRRPMVQPAYALPPGWQDMEGESVPVDAGIVNPAPIEPVHPPAVRTVAAEPSPSLSRQGLALLVWVMIALALLLLLIQRALFVKGLVAQADPAPNSLQEKLDACCDRMGLRGTLALKVSSNVTSPACCGLLRPVILIPRNLVPRLQPRDVQAVLLHELAHIKRGDLWINLIQTLLQIVYFYHPLLWLANAMIRRTREQAVDEAVLVAMGASARQYPETLVNIAKLAFRRRPTLSLRLIGVVESKSALRSRIKHMLTRPLPKTARLSLLGLFAIVLVAVILLPMARGREDRVCSSPSCLALLPDCGVWMSDINGQDLPVLDLASGRIIGLPSVKSDYDLVQTTSSQGEGDILYYYDRAEQKPRITFLRSAGFAGTATPDETLTRTIVPPELPWHATLTTLERASYEIEITQANEDACLIRFRPLGERSASLKAILPDNMTVELVGICEYASEGRWWRPDGQILSEIPCTRHPRDQMSSWSGARTYEIAFRLGRTDGLDFEWHAEGASGYMVNYPHDPNTGSMLSEMRLLIARFPSDQRTARIGIDITRQSAAGSQAEWLQSVRFDEISLRPLQETNAWVSAETHDTERARARMRGRMPLPKLVSHSYYRTGDPIWIAVRGNQGTPWKPTLDEVYRDPDTCSVFYLIDGQEYDSRHGFGPFDTWGQTLHLPGSLYIDEADFHLSPGRHTVAYGWRDVNVTAPNDSDNPVHFNRLATDPVEFEVVEDLPPDYYRPVYQDGWEDFLRQSIETPFTDDMPRYGVAGPLLALRVDKLPFDTSFEVYIQAEGSEQRHRTGELALAAGSSLIMGCDRDVDELNWDTVGDKRWRIILKPSVEVAKKHPPIREFYGRELVTDWVSFERSPRFEQRRQAFERRKNEPAHYGGTVAADRPVDLDVLGRRWRGQTPAWPLPDGFELGWSPENGGTLRIDPSSGVRLLWLPEANARLTHVRAETRQRLPELADSRMTEIVLPPEEPALIAVLSSEGRVYFVRARRVDETWADLSWYEDQEGTRTFGDTSKRDRLVANLSHGGTLELMAVRKLSTPGQHWYSPDGRTWIDPNTDPALSHRLVPGKPTEKAEASSYEFFVHGDLPDNAMGSAVKSRWRFEPAPSTLGGLTRRFLSGQQYLGVSLQFPARVERVDVTVEISNGPWTTVASHDGRKSVQKTFVHRGQTQTLTLGEIVDEDGSVSIAAEHNVRELAVRIVAFTSYDVARHPLTNILNPAGNRLKTLCRFDGLTPERIDHYELQIQPIDIVTFRNVSLENGLYTRPVARVRSTTESTPLDPDRTAGPEQVAEAESLSLHTRRVYLPDLETPNANVVLDLATGQLLSAEPAQGDEAYFNRLGKGDIAYEYVSGKSGLLCLRGGRLTHRTEAGIEPLAPDVTRDAFVVYFIEDVPVRYRVTTAEGDTYDLNVLSIDRGDRGGALVEFAQTAGGASEEQTIRLPDVDVRPRMLDLATGRLIPLPQADSPDETWRRIEELGQGDLVYDSHKLILVRHATSPQAQAGPVAPFRTYDIASLLPKTLTVTTAEGQSYRVTISSADDDTCEFVYAPLASDGSGRSGGLGASVNAQAALALRIVPEQEDFTTEALEAYREALDGVVAGGQYLWVPVREGTNLPPKAVVAEREGRRWLLVHNDELSIMVSGQDWRLARVDRTADAMGRPAIMLKFDDAGAKCLWKLTEAHVGTPLAIVVNNVVVSSPIVMGPVQSPMVTGNLADEQVEDMIAALRETMTEPPHETGASVEFRPVPRPQAEPVGRYALSFDGAGDCLIVPPNPSLDLRSPFFIEVWLKPDASAIEQADRTGETSDRRSGPLLSVMRRGIDFRASEPSSDGGFLLSMNLSFDPPGEWFGSLYTKETGRRVLVQVGGSKCEHLDTGHSGWLHVGAACNRTDYMLASQEPLIVGPGVAGEVAEIRIWDKVLTDTELRGYGSASLTGNEPNLVACWTFDEGSGQIVHDISPNANHAHLGSTIDADADDPTWVGLAAGDQVGLDASRQEVAGVVLDPNGSPVAGAQVALCTENTGTRIRAPRLLPVELAGKSSEIVETDADGRFVFPDVPADFLIVASHESGFARVDGADYAAAGPLRLERWGQIEGTVYVGGKPAANQGVSLSFGVVPSYAAFLHFLDCAAYTGPGGRFVLTKVVPGWLEIGREEYSGRMRTNCTPIYVKPGETLDVTLGAEGRPIIGRVVLPADSNRPAGLRWLSCRLVTVRPDVPWPAQSDQMSGAEKGQWYRQWRKTAQGRAYVEAAYHNPNRRTYGFAPDENNFFRIDDVIPGRYDVMVSFLDRTSPAKLLGPYSGVVEVPPVAEHYSDETLDLGTIALTEQSAGPLSQTSSANDTGAGGGALIERAVPDAKECMLQLGLAAVLYTKEHNGNLPADLGLLKPYLSQPEVFAWLQKSITFMVYTGKDNARDYPELASLPIAFQKVAGSTADRYVTYYDGHVKLVEAAPHEPAGPLQKLIDEAPDGATVTVPKGTYVTPVEITKPLVLRGESFQECIVEVTADEPALLIDTLGRGQVTVENLTIKWQQATDGRSESPRSSSSALWVKESDVLIRSCLFTPLGDNRRCPTAVRIDDHSDVTIDACRFNGFEFTVCYGPGSGGVVQNCVLINPGHQGVTGYENSTLRVERTIVVGSGYHGLRCTGGTLHARDNILVDNRVSGVYLGNKDGRGTVINNLLLRNAEGIAGFYRADFSVENNVIADSTVAGVGAWSTCRLNVRNNVFQNNATALIVYPKDSPDINIIGRNLFWQNIANAKDCVLPADSIQADPRFADPNAGDFSSIAARGQGLTDPQVIRQLWPRYEQARRESQAIVAKPSPVAVPSVQVQEAAPVSSDLAWQRTDRYMPPDPNGFFPDDEEAGKKLDALFQALDKDQRSDEEILTTVRQGFRRTKQYRTLILSWIGNRYVWGKDPQNPEAVEIMYHAVPMARHYAVYFGLSVLKHKTPNVLRTLADICLQGEDVGRITWGIGAQREELVGYIKPHLNDPDPARREMASVLVKHFAGEMDFEQWQRQQRNEQAKVQFAGQLPQFKETLLSGDSRARREVLRTIRGNGLASILDDSFLPAMKTAATDRSPEVRRDIASMVGGRWIWAQQEQHPAAVALVLELASDTDRDTRYNAVYFGLSTLRDKTEPVIRRLVELALADHENNLYGRIVWGLKGPMRAAPEPFERILAEHLDAARTNVHLAASVYLLYRDVLGQEPPSDWSLERVTQRYPEDLFMLQFSAKAPFEPDSADALWREFAGGLPAGVTAEHMPGYRNRKPFVCIAKVRGKRQAEIVRQSIEDNPRLTVGQLQPMSLQLQLYYGERYGVTSLPRVTGRSEQQAEADTAAPGPIQRRINDAAPGDTITLPAGVFEERLVIDKPLTLEGAGWDKTTIRMRVDGPAVAEQMQRAIQERIGGTTNESEISAVARQVRDLYSRPVVLVTSTRAATIRGIKFSCLGTTVEGHLLPIPVLRFGEATAHLTNCAIVGAVGNGIEVAGGCNVEIDHSLVAAAWSTGIVVAEQTDRLTRVQIRDCDIRNCYYAGIRIGKGNNDVVIARCRISGAAWHGIRYDDASPAIEDNLIFHNARSGIYASGQTKAVIARNLFYANEMCGLSCWFNNQDLVWMNTFAENKRSGLEILGASQPTVLKNIFYANPTGISGGSINDDSPSAKSGAPVLPRGCLFWANECNMQWRIDPNTTETMTLEDDTGTRHVDPEFVSVAAKDFALPADSPIRRNEIGVLDPIPFASSWALQPEETAIIPAGDTRHYRQWKRP